MPQTILGIDVGTYSVKVAELRRSFKGFAFVNFYEHKIRYNEVLTPDESMATAVQAVLEDNALTWDSAFVALPATAVATRLITLPFNQPKKIEQVIPFEVENYVPFAVDDVIYDHHLVDTGTESAHVILFYALKTEVAKFLSFMNNVGVEPRRLCVTGVELVNVMTMGLVAPEVLYAVLDIGHEHTVMTVCRGRRLVFTRTAMVGGKQMTAEIAKAVGVSLDEAERLKVEMGQVGTGELPPPETIPYKVTQALHTVLDDLILEIRQTFFAVREQYGEAVEAVYLCGGTARLPGLDHLLSVRLQQNVTPIECRDFGFTHLEQTDLPPATACTALAIGLRGVAATGLPAVDFRRGEFTYRADTQQVGGQVRRVAVAALLLIGLAVASFGLRWYMLNRRLATLQQETIQLIGQILPKDAGKKLTAPDAALKVLDGEVRDMERRIERLDRLLKQSALNTLARFSEGVPGRDAVQLNVEKFQYSGATLKVSAMVTTGADLDKIRHTIEERFTERKGADGKPLPPGDGQEPLVVTFPEAKPGAKGEIKFDVVMQTKAGADEEQKGKRRR